MGRTVKINGEELNIKFNFATELAYEDLTGKPFDVADVVPIEGNDAPKSNNILKLAVACLIANNPDAKTDADYLLYNATRDEVFEIIKATLAAMLDWLPVPKVAEAHVPEQNDKTDDEPKNV